MKVTIDKERALDLLHQAVEQRGADFHYESPGLVDDGFPCLYWHEHEGKPGCLVGLAFSLAGVEPDALQAFDVSPPSGEDHQDGTGIGSVYNRGVLAEHDVHLNGDALNVFRAAQRCQDAGLTWGAALEQAKVAI